MSYTFIELAVVGMVTRGADGLYNPDDSCGCTLDDLAPCGDPWVHTCVEARNDQARADAEKVDFWMVPIEPPPE